MKYMPIQIKDVTLFSVEEISRVLNRDTTTVRYYLKQGRLNGQKIYGKWVVSYDDLMVYLKIS
jgi:predicted transcriptional regulator